MTAPRPFASEILEVLLLLQIHAQRDGDLDLDADVERGIDRLRALDEYGFAAALPAALAAALDASLATLTPRLDVTERDVAEAEALLAVDDGPDVDLYDDAAWEAELERMAARATAGVVLHVPRDRGTVAAPPRRPAATILQRRATRLSRARNRAHRPTAARRRCRGSSPPVGDGRSSSDEPPGAPGSDQTGAA